MVARPETSIGPLPPRDGRQWDSQCARCGSSTYRALCENCGGDGVYGHDCGDDSCCCGNPVENVPCDLCLGAGGRWMCLSEPKWCEANPLPGRERVHGIEWFTFDLRRAEA